MRGQDIAEVGAIKDVLESREYLDPYWRSPFAWNEPVRGVSNGRGGPDLHTKADRFPEIELTRKHRKISTKPLLGGTEGRIAVL